MEKPSFLEERKRHVARKTTIPASKLVSETAHSSQRRTGTSVARSTLETELPSSRRRRTISAFSTGRYMPSKVWSRASVNTLWHWLHWLRWRVPRLPNFRHSVRQLWQVIVKLSLSSTAIRQIMGLRVRYGESCVGYSPGQCFNIGWGFRMKPTVGFEPTMCTLARSRV
jgi:hypothetical protein